MSMPRLAVLLLMLGPASAAELPHLGRPADPARIAALDVEIAPDGKGLPPGRGSVAKGAAIFVEKCAACHGDRGEGQPGDRLTGGIGTLASSRPVRTVASYWPYATTLFGYIRSAMPVTAPRSVAPDEAYALCAYLLSIDGIVPKNAVLDARTLPKVRMPNRRGFIDMWEKPAGR